MILVDGLSAVLGKVDIDFGAPEDVLVQELTRLVAPRCEVTFEDAHGFLKVSDTLKSFELVEYTHPSGVKSWGFTFIPHGMSDRVYVTDLGRFVTWKHAILGAWLIVEDFMKTQRTKVYIMNHWMAQVLLGYQCLESEYTVAGRNYALDTVTEACDRLTSCCLHLCENDDSWRGFESMVGEFINTCQEMAIDKHWSTMTKQSEQHCAGFFFEHCGCFLLIKRSKDKHLGFPCGKSLAGESPVDTALRETLEETGLEVTEVGPRVYTEVVDGVRVYIFEALAWSPNVLEFDQREEGKPAFVSINFWKEFYNNSKKGYTRKDIDPSPFDDFNDRCIEFFMAKKPDSSYKIYPDTHPDSFF